MIHLAAALAGCVLLGIALADALDTIVLARRAKRIFRVTAWFYAITWGLFAFFAKRLRSGERRERVLSIYGPLSLLALLALWAASTILSFALLHYAAGLRVANRGADFEFAFTFSGATLFTVAVAEPLNRASKYLMFLEAASGSVCWAS